MCGLSMLDSLVVFLKLKPTQMNDVDFRGLNERCSLEQAAKGPAQAPQTLSSLAEQVLSTIMPNEESVLRLAGLATGGATASRVAPEGEDPGAPTVPRHVPPLLTPHT